MSIDTPRAIPPKMVFPEPYGALFYGTCQKFDFLAENIFIEFRRRKTG